MKLLLSGHLHPTLSGWTLLEVRSPEGSGLPRLSGLDAVDYVSWGRWVTWAFQVMPVFFLVGGYVHAQSWTDHHARRESWAWWVRDRVMRLWWPTAVFVVAGILVVVGARAAGADPGEVDRAARIRRHPGRASSRGWVAATRLLARPRLWGRVARLNETAMTVYLWHFVPVIVVAAAFYPTGVMPQPAVATAPASLAPCSAWSGSPSPDSPGREPAHACPGRCRGRPGRDLARRPHPGCTRRAAGLRPQRPEQPPKAA